MEFEFDPVKSDANNAKHGIDFVEAQALGYDAAKRILPLSFQGEVRLMCIGKIGSVLWAAIFTWRGRRIRIISVRRVRKSERLIYEQDLG